jgi:hypothetical protein
MPIRLKFGNDLNIFGNSRGAGNFISSPVAGGGYPAYGTYIRTDSQINRVGYYEITKSVPVCVSMGCGNPRS